MAPVRTLKEREEIKEIKEGIGRETDKGEENLIIWNNKIVTKKPFHQPTEKW